MFIPYSPNTSGAPAKPVGTFVEGGMFSGSELVAERVLPVGEWVEERVNVYEDFKRIHEALPEKAWGIRCLLPRVEIDFGAVTVGPAK